MIYEMIYTYADLEDVEVPETDEEGGSSDSSASSASEVAEEAEAAEEAKLTKTFQLGTSSYTIEIPESFDEGEKSEEDAKNGLVVYMKSPEFKTDFDVYQYSKEGCPEDLAEHVQNEAAKYNTTDIKTDVDVNGVTVARCEAIEPFEGKDYDTITYYLDDGDTYVEIVFWLWDEASEEQAETIFSTLSSTKN